MGNELTPEPKIKLTGGSSLPPPIKSGEPSLGTFGEEGPSITPGPHREKSVNLPPPLPRREGGAEGGPITLPGNGGEIVNIGGSPRPNVPAPEQPSQITLPGGEGGIVSGIKSLWGKISGAFKGGGETHAASPDPAPGREPGKIQPGVGANPWFREEGGFVSLGPVLERPSHYHGSGSASLIDVMRGGLKAAGDLIKEGKAPFCGELQQGIAPGAVNNRSISAVARDFITKAVEYATEPGSITSWTPATGLKEIADNTRWLNEPPDPKNPNRAQNDIACRKQIEINTQRIARWAGLSEGEQSLVSSPFPVVYGVIGAVENSKVRSQISGEVGIEGAPASRIVAFVPPGTVAALRETAEKLGSALKVEPYERMLDYYGKNPPLQLEWQIRRLNDRRVPGTSSEG